jgi:hypothetical protein
MFGEIMKWNQADRVAGEEDELASEVQPDA